MTGPIVAPTKRGCHRRASTRRHQKILVSGTIGAFQLCNDKRLDQFWTYREHSAKVTPCLFLRDNGIGTAGTMTKMPQPCQICSSNAAAAK